MQSNLSQKIRFKIEVGEVCTEGTGAERNVLSSTAFDCRRPWTIVRSRMRSFGHGFRRAFSYQQRHQDASLIWLRASMNQSTWSSRTIMILLLSSWWRLLWGWFFLGHLLVDDISLGPLIVFWRALSSRHQKHGTQWLCWRFILLLIGKGERNFPPHQLFAFAVGSFFARFVTHNPFPRRLC